MVYVDRIKSFISVTERILDRDPQVEMQKAFKLFDDDDSGKISLRNLRRVARELGKFAFYFIICLVIQFNSLLTPSYSLLSQKTFCNDRSLQVESLL